MARLGAKGKTATEMDKAFYFPPDEKVLLDGYEKAMQTFQVRLGDWNDQRAVLKGLNCTVKLRSLEPYFRWLRLNITSL